MSAETEAYTEEEKTWLHRMARQAIEYRLTGRPLPTPEGETALLKEKRGAFVTLKRQGQLRGCIGYTRAIKPLSRTIMEMAQAAAFEDPRFPPLTQKELADLEIEISKHGLFLERGGRSGLLLPQVATEYRWDRQTFLEHTCLKAGLPREAWQDPETRIYVFSAEIF
jgi:AMMECR1 domain-containing protein